MIMFCVVYVYLSSYVDGEANRGSAKDGLRKKTAGEKVKGNRFAENTRLEYRVSKL